MSDIDFTKFRAAVRYQGMPEVEPHEVRVNKDSMQLGTDIVNRLRSDLFKDRVNMTISYSKEQNALLLLRPSKDNTDNSQLVFSNVIPANGKLNMAIPVSLRKVDIVKGRYFAHPNHPGVYVLKSRFSNKHFQLETNVQSEKAKTDYTFDEKASVGDVVSWIARVSDGSSYIATGIVEKIWDRVQPNGEKVKFAKIIAVSKRYTDRYNDGQVPAPINVKLDNIIVREKRATQDENRK